MVSKSNRNQKGSRANGQVQENLMVKTLTINGDKLHENQIIDHQKEQRKGRKTNKQGENQAAAESVH